MHSPPQCVEFHLSVLAFRVGEGDGVGEVIRVERVVVVKSSVQVGVYCEGVCVCVGGGGEGGGRGGGRGGEGVYSHPGESGRTPHYV